MEPVKLSSSEARKEYQRRYYHLHKERAKEYQRQYNLTHKKSGKGRGSRADAGFDAPREVVRITFNRSELMHMPTEKAARAFTKIIRGDRQLV